MSWTVCVSASSTDGALSTTANLRLVLGATSTANDAYQQQVLVRASKWAENYIGHPLLAQVYNERVAAYGGSYLMLSHTPIRSLLRMFSSTTTEDATSITTTEIWIESEDAGTVTRPSGFDWTARGIAGVMSEGVAPGSELKPWLFEYQAGYVFPETSSTSYGTTSTGRTLPDDIEQAVLLKAAEMVRQGQSAGIASKSVGDLSITYGSAINRNIVNYRSEAEELLAPYKRLA